MRRPSRALTVLLLPVAVAAAFAISLPLEMSFRSAVAESEFVVVGRIVGTDHVDSTVCERTSNLLVERVVVGAAGVGESLRVKWDAAEWYPQEGMIVRTSDSLPALSDMEGVTALWCLGYMAGTDTAIGGLRELCEPLRLIPENRDQVVAVLEVLPNEAILKRVQPESANMEDRVRAVAKILESWLEETR